jgi:hypothetical protein
LRSAVIAPVSEPLPPSNRTESSAQRLVTERPRAAKVNTLSKQFLITAASEMGTFQLA